MVPVEPRRSTRTLTPAERERLEQRNKALIELQRRRDRERRDEELEPPKRRPSLRGLRGKEPGEWHQVPNLGRKAAG